MRSPMFPVLHKATQDIDGDTDGEGLLPKAKHYKGI